MTNKLNRRKFLRTGAIAASGAAALSAPSVARAQTVTMKMQAAWAVVFSWKMQKHM